MKIEKIDKNFSTAANVGGAVWYDVKSAPFKTYGVYFDASAGLYARMPFDVAKSVSNGVGSLCRHTCGGRIRFGTDSPFVAVKITLDGVTGFPHMPLSGTSGAALYAEFSDGCDRFLGAVIPPYDTDGIYEGRVDVSAYGRPLGFTLYLPLYNGVKDVRIGLAEGSALSAGPEYECKKPVVFYGSSITQGGCASRPGADYVSVLSRILNVDVVNLGFSGSARGERTMAEYLSVLDCSVFVMDYDHNATDATELEKTHNAFFGIFRSAKPETPVIFISRPDLKCGAAEVAARFAVIERTYLNAKRNGDKNVYLIDGRNLFAGRDGDGCTVDGVHPTDLGFMRMAEKIAPVLKAAYYSALRHV